MNLLTPPSSLFDKFTTGDIILVHGRYFFSQVIELVVGSIWSHSAVVIRKSDIDWDKHPIATPPSEMPDLLLWESNTLTNLVDYVTGTHKEGPMLVDLKERMRTSFQDFPDVLVAHRSLHTQWQPAMLEAFLPFAAKVSPATFPGDLKMGIMLFEGRFLNRQSDENEFFCSELVAGTYINTGILTTKYPYNHYDPKDFSDAGSVDLLNGSWLGRQTIFNKMPD